jgi:endonuclease/exonuclease/phosphatase family metal-dependent hydrolase
VKERTPTGTKSTARRGALPRRGFLRALLLLGTFPVLAAALFVSNGVSSSWKKPQVGSGGGSVRTEPLRQLKVLALNVAKCRFHEGGLSFAHPSLVRERLDRIAERISEECPDLVCLSEVVMEAGPMPGNQVEYLARKCKFASYVTGENYSFGLPFCRIRSGNALLTNLPVTPLEVVQLAGARSRFLPSNNRRALWCEVRVNGQPILTGSLRNDSFDLENNLLQAREILAYVGDRRALLAGDFNAEPATASMEAFRATGRFAGLVETPPTFPARKPARRIDYVLAPAGWKLLEQHVVDTGVSDHLAVLSTFELPQ